MAEKVIIRFRRASALSSASRNHLTTFCRPVVHYACLRLCSAIVHFIRNNCIYFVCYGWAAQTLTPLATSGVGNLFCTVDRFKQEIFSRAGLQKPQMFSDEYLLRLV